MSAQGLAHAAPGLGHWQNALPRQRPQVRGRLCAWVGHSHLSAHNPPRRACWYRPPPHCQNSATGTRTRVARVRAEYPNQLDYSGVATPPPRGRRPGLHLCNGAIRRPHGSSHGSSHGRPSSVALKGALQSRFQSRFQSRSPFFRRPYCSGSGKKRNSENEWLEPAQSWELRKRKRTQISSEVRS